MSEEVQVTGKALFRSILEKKKQAPWLSETALQGVLRPFL